MSRIVVREFQVDVAASRIPPPISPSYSRPVSNGQLMVGVLAPHGVASNGVNNNNKECHVGRSLQTHFFFFPNHPLYLVGGLPLISMPLCQPFSLFKTHLNGGSPSQCLARLSFVKVSEAHTGTKRCRQPDIESDQPQTNDAVLFLEGNWAQLFKVTEVRVNYQMCREREKEVKKQLVDQASAIDHAT